MVEAVEAVELAAAAVGVVEREPKSSVPKPSRVCKGRRSLSLRPELMLRSQEPSGQSENSRTTDFVRPRRMETDYAKCVGRK